MSANIGKCPLALKIAPVENFQRNETVMVKFKSGVRKEV